MPLPIDRPIFIVGCPRSGTGLLHQLMRLHPNLAWVTPLTNWICGHDWQDTLGIRTVRAAERLLLTCPPTLRPPFLRGPFDGSLSVPDVPETHEGHSIWNRHLPADQHAATAEDVTPGAQDYLHRVIRWHMRYFERPRFICKTPRNLFRIPYFHAVFSDAHFVHLVRDGRAVAASILKRRRLDAGSPNRWWGVKPPGWRAQRARPPIEQCAWTWLQCLRTIDRVRGTVVPETQIHTLCYETLTQSPDAALRPLFSTLGCSPDAYALPPAIRERVHPPRPTWRKQLTPAQIEALSMLDKALEAMGYAP